MHAQSDINLFPSIYFFLQQSRKINKKERSTTLYPLTWHTNIKNQDEKKKSLKRQNICI